MNLKDLFASIKNKLAPSAPAADTLPEEDIYELKQRGPVRDADSDPFLHSLATLTADDLAPAEPKKKLTASDIISEIFRRGIVIVCAGIFIYNGAILVQSLIHYQQGDELYDSIAESFFDENLTFGQQHAIRLSPASGASASLPDYYTGLTMDAEELPEDLNAGNYNPRFEQLKAKLSALKEINKDVYGWIKIDGTNINYPIMKPDSEANRSFYLDHTITGDYMVCGSVYADYRTYPRLLDNNNIVLYAHNMNNGSMFNNVMLFLEKDVFESKLIEVITFDGIYTYEPFAIFETNSSYQYFRTYFESDEDFVAFCEEMQSKSLYNKGITFTGEDRVITFSTCTNNYTATGRYAMHARLIKVER